MGKLTPPIIRPIPLGAPGTPPPASIARYLWRVSRWPQIALAVMALCTTGLGLVPIELQRRMIDDAILERDAALLWQLSLFYALAAIAQQALKWLMKAAQGWLSESAVLRGRRTLLDVERHHRANGDEAQGASVSVLGAELDKLGGFIGVSPSQAVANLGMLLGVVGYMLAVQPGLAWVSLLLLLPNLVVTPLLQRKLNHYIRIQVRAMRDFGNAVTASSGEGVTGPLTALLYDNRVRFQMWNSLLKSLLGVLNAAAPLSVLLVGGLLVLEGEATAGTLVAFLSGFQRIAGPIRDLIGFYREAAQASVRYDMIRRWM